MTTTASLPVVPRRADVAHCAALVRRHARTFALASRFLGAEKRRAAFAVYAFCRTADDIVDEPADGADAAAVRRALERHRSAMIQALGGEPRSAPFRELAWAVHRFGIPAAPLHQLLDTVHRDVDGVVVERWDDLTGYCAGVASTVGTLCAHVFGVPGDGAARAGALRHARTLGVAMQLTNILRDVGEDAARGRCYLPREDLAAHGLDRPALLAGAVAAADPRWQALMRQQIARARGLYAEAAPGLAMVADDARCCATICARGYAAILDAIERVGHDSLRRRARVPAATKLRIALRAWYEAPRRRELPALGRPAAR